MRKLLLLGLFSLAASGCGGGGGEEGPSTGTGGANTGGTNDSAGADTGGGHSGGSGTGGSATGGGSATAGAGTGGASSTAGAGTGGAQTTDDCVPLPENSRVYDHILSLVDPDMTAALTDYLQQPVVRPDGQEPLELDFPSRVFYGLYPDEYDFLVFLSAEDVSDTCEGMHSSVNTPDIPGTGVARFHGQAYGSVGRLLSVIGMDFRDFDTRPPFAHEVAHHWGVYLDESLGFGDDFEGGYAAHWGTASVHGLLGGFDGSTLRCKSPADALPPDCTAEPDGRIHYVVGRFSPLSGSFLDLPYAPLELYLMGLTTADEIPQTYTILTDAAPEPLEVDPATGDMTIDASGMTEVSVDDIIAEEGPRTPYTEDERSFTMAVVLLTAKPATDSMLQAASRWAESFGGHAPDAPWPSFEELTGGRARMETRLGRCRHIGEEDGPPPERKTQCDVLLQDCDPGLACYDADLSVCLPEGDAELGEPCEQSRDCAKGLECSSTGAMSLCAPYCDPNDTNSPLACETLCPGASVEVWSASPMGVVGAYCMPGSGSGTCDPLAQTCGDGFGCYGRESATCQSAGTIAAGDTCVPMGAVCVPGTECIGFQGEDAYCQPYCDPAGSAANACTTLCPAGAWNYGDYSICMPD
jgi:hypothetical protein